MLIRCAFTRIHQYSPALGITQTHHNNFHGWYLIANVARIQACRPEILLAFRKTADLVQPRRHQIVTDPFSHESVGSGDETTTVSGKAQVG